MQLIRYNRKPFSVSGVKVTDANMKEIAAWCGGTIRTEPAQGVKPATKYIEVHVIPVPRNPKQNRAYVGYFVLVSSGRFKVYTPEALEQSFVPDLETLPLDLNPLARV